MRDFLTELRSKGLLGEREILQGKALSMGIGFVDIERVQIDSSAFNSVSAELVTITQAIPVKRDGSTIWLAISQTDAMDVLDAYKMATGCRIIPVLATAKAISQAINRYFPAGGFA